MPLTPVHNLIAAKAAPTDASIAVGALRKRDIGVIINHEKMGGKYT